MGCARWLRAQGIKVGQVRDDFRGGRGWQEVDRARENQRPRPADRLQLEGRAARRAGPCGLDTNKVRRRSRLEEAVSESHQSTAHSHVESCLRHVAIAVERFTSSPSGTRVTFIKAFRYKKNPAHMGEAGGAAWLRAPSAFPSF